MKSVFFEIPKGHRFEEAVIGIVESIPDDWFVEFHEVAGGAASTGVTPVREDRTVAVLLVRGGHRNNIDFSSNGRRSASLALCTMHLKPWSGYVRSVRGSSVSPKDHPPLVEISWNEHRGGRREDVEGIIQACRALGLEEYGLVSAAS